MNRRLVIVAAALALALGGLPLMAQQNAGGGFGPGPRAVGQGRGGRGPGGPMGVFPGLAQLDLTDAQREQIRTIVEQERQAAGNPGEKLRQAEQTLHAALLADTPDQQAIEAAKAALNAAQSAELDARVQLMSKIASILTPAQRQQLAQMPPPPGGRRGGAPGRPGHKPYI